MFPKSFPHVSSGGIKKKKLIKLHRASNNSVNDFRYEVQWAVFVFYLPWAVLRQFLNLVVSSVLEEHYDEANEESYHEEPDKKIQVDQQIHSQPFDFCEAYQNWIRNKTLRVLIPGNFKQRLSFRGRIRSFKKFEADVNVVGSSLISDASVEILFEQIFVYRFDHRLVTDVGASVKQLQRKFVESVQARLLRIYLIFWQL